MNLPRLLYIGDVPVENSYHGSALLYRLLRSYPPDRLSIVESGVQSSQPDRRLPSVPYRFSPQPGRRFLTTRLNRWAVSVLSLLAPLRRCGSREALAAFRPEAVLTVAHGFSWLSAAAYAQAHGLPLHLIVHDDWPRMARAISPVRRWIDDQFARCYRQARTRLCVSPYMVDFYHERYGVRGSLLYPSRSPETTEHVSPPSRPKADSDGIVYAFGGTINTGGHAAALRSLAEVLAPRGGRLHLYGPLTPADAEVAGLVQPNIRLCGLAPADQFIQRLRDEVDVLFVPMSFAARDEGNTSLSFPSKLTDYTAAALPLLIHGPAYSSAVRWAHSHPGVAEVVEQEGSEYLATAVQRLASPAHRHGLALEAARVGRDCFSPAQALDTFHAALTNA